MSVIEALGDVVKAYPGTRVVAFADLSASMILASQGTGDVTQEYLERLLRQARASFDDPLFALSVEAFGEPHGAMILGDADVRLFLRSESEPADALCCVCDHGIDLPGILAKTRAVLDGISSG